MNPAIVSATVFVVGAIAAALCYVFTEQPQTYQHRDNVFNFNFDSSSHNYYPPGRSTTTENGIRKRKKERKTIKFTNDNCSICLEHLSGSIEVLSCEHAYHVLCLNNYSESQDLPVRGKLLCPLCRQPID